jgi:hypothetical protein
LGHHKVFCGIRKPLRAWGRPRKKAANEKRCQRKGLRQCRSPLLEGLSLMCADQFASWGRCPAETVAQAFVACHDIVKSQNGACEKMFLFFPIRFGSGKRSRAFSPRTLPLFPE